MARDPDWGNVGKRARLAPRGLMARCQQGILIPSACSVACTLLYFLASLQVAKVSVLVLGEH
jgi:hypothetical protein